MSSNPFSLIDCDAIAKIGLFDAEFENGFEDTDFSIRAYLNGFEGVVDFGVIFKHKGGASLGRHRLIKKPDLWIKNMKRLYSKYSPAVYEEFLERCRVQTIMLTA